jgi:hypothetical protein
MFVLAHIMGVPVEELLMSCANGVGVGTLMLLASGIGSLTPLRMRRRR